jgi:voltage-gated sodium channel
MYIGGFYNESYIFVVLDSIFTLLFLIEAIVKIKTYGWKAYWSDGWNKFDFILVLCAMPSLLNLVADTGLSTNILLSFRTFRAFKSFRLFQFIPNIEYLIRGVKLACKASFVVVIAFLILLLVFSILTSTIFGNIAPEYFGDPATATYSIFRLFTIEGWYEMPDAIARNSQEGMSTFAKVYFSILLFAGGIIGMSLVNSIFVDAMAQDNNDEIMDKLKEIEKKIDEMKN